MYIVLMKNKDVNEYASKHIGGLHWSQKILWKEGVINQPGWFHVELLNLQEKGESFQIQNETNSSISLGNCEQVWIEILLARDLDNDPPAWWTAEQQQEDPLVFVEREEHKVGRRQNPKLLSENDPLAPNTGDFWEPECLNAFRQVGTPHNKKKSWCQI